jgi:hypothetical protein
MKKILLQLLVVIAITSSLDAQEGKIIIRNASNNYPKFIASLNGIRLSNDYNSISTFSYLDDNSYRLKLLQAGSANVLTFALASEPKYLSKYVITKDNVGNYTVILESKSLILDEMEAPLSATVAEIPRTPSVTNTPSVIPTTSIAITNISAAEFDERLGAVKKTSFDDKRLGKAKQVFDDEILSTNQIIEVLKVFSFDDSKLAFAKWAYADCIDKKNYYKLDDQFSFGSSKQSLSDFIKKQPK